MSELDTDLRARTERLRRVRDALTTDLVERETIAALHLRRRDLGAGGEAQLCALGRPPRRQHHTETSLLEDKSMIGEEGYGTGGVGDVKVGKAAAQTILQNGAKPHRSAQGR